MTFIKQEKVGENPKTWSQGLAASGVVNSARDLENVDVWEVNGVEDTSEKDSLWR